MKDAVQSKYANSHSPSHKPSTPPFAKPFPVSRLIVCTFMLSCVLDTVASTYFAGPGIF